MKSFLILGGTGKTGRRIVARLTDAGHPVRTAGRVGADAHVDLDDPATHARALDGIDAAYLLEPGLDAGDRNSPRMAALVDAAVAAGVRRLVLLSAPGADHETHALHTTEQAVRRSGLEWTVLRPHWFAQNFSEGFWLPAVRGGRLALPAGDRGVAFIDAEDIADVAVAALTEDRHAGQIYELTGPRALTFGEAAEVIANASGKPLEFVAITPHAFLEQQVSAGVPLQAAQRRTHLMSLAAGGASEAVSGDVEQVLGRAARGFEDFAAAAAATGCWS